MGKAKYVKELKFVKKLLIKEPGVSISSAVRQACEKYGLEYHERIRKAINKSLVIAGSGKKQKPISREFLDAQKKTFDKKKETFIITWAQNATGVHRNLWRNIEAYTEHLNANLHVIAGRYRNPTSAWTVNQESDEWWTKEVKPHLDANRHNIHPLLQVLSDVKVQPTAAQPLTGFNGFTALESCIVGHPRQHLKSLPVLEGYPHKLLLSTGACTQPNYTDSKAGKKGEFHHMLGFIVVELDGEDFHIRQVNADANGNFYDVYKRALNGKIIDNEDGMDAVILGDVHVRHNDEVVTKAAFGLIEKMKPKHIVVHDVSEMESILHWDEKNPFRLLQKEEQGLDNLEEEIEGVMKWLDKHKDYGHIIIARSNHDDMLDRWLMHTDWRKAKNKKMYLKLSNILAESKNAQVKGILPYLIDERFGDKITTLSLDDSFRIHGWELAMHGHLGANGSRGGHNQFKNLNTKNIVGHGHHPHREDGHIMVGTLSHLRVGFNRGASNWMNSLGGIYPDGRAQLIHFINGKMGR